MRWRRMILAVVVGSAASARPGIIVAVLFAAAGRTPAPNHCWSCAYNLTGDVSGRCPECGEAI